MLAPLGDEPPDQEHPLQQLVMAALSYYDGLDEQLEQETGIDIGLQGVSLFVIDASKVRLTLFAPAAPRVDSEAAPRRSQPIVCRLVNLLHACSRCDTPPPGRVPVPGC
jgi:hypothetical protein